MVALNVFFKLLSRQTSTESYLFLKVLVACGWKSIAEWDLTLITVKPKLARAQNLFWNEYTSRCIFTLTKSNVDLSQ